MFTFNIKSTLLDINLLENYSKFHHLGHPLSTYPSIKCNISKKTGEKIYHLPFDQQYDKTLIEGEKNESYAETVNKAEVLGFRRAWKWKGIRES